MTKEEAIYWLDNGWRQSLEGKYREAFDMAISVLRPITREQVEKVWRGCEYCAGDVNDRPYLDSKEIYIYDDGILMNGYESACKILFCPKCGRPLTDEAVDMVTERLEALYE